MRLKLLVVTLIGSLLLFAPTAVSAEQSWVGDAGKAWPPPNDAERGLHVQQFLDSSPGTNPSFLIDNELRSKIFVDPTCSSISDARCTANPLQYSAQLPVCVVSTDLNCIEEFGSVLPTGEKTKAVFNRNFPTRAQNAFVGDANLKLPSGSTGALFNFPEGKHAGGDLYYVSVLSSGSAYKSGIATLDNFSIRITPVALQRDPAIRSPNGGNSEPGWLENKTGSAGGRVGSWRWVGGTGLTGEHFCAAVSAAENMCAERYAFPSGIKFYVKVRTQLAPSGWMHGRIYNPDISLLNIDGNYTLEVAAFPVAVPVVYKSYRYQAMPQPLKDQYDVPTGDFKPEVATWDSRTIADRIAGGCGRTACTTDPLTRNKMLVPSPSDPFGMEQLKLWIPFVEDKATALLGTWSMRTLEPNESKGADRCFSNGSQGITGIVTTNATQYLAGPPTFNTTEQSLEYKVAAPHLTPKGEIFYGSYNLLMRSDVARCVYGFTNAPIKGSISIISDKGEQKVATESINEIKGWVSLSANGFTYSAPTIRVKLSQDKPEPVKVEETTPVAVAAPNQEVQQAAKPIVVSKKKTITCTKGKVTKKISGTNPKCPTGFKTKASPEPSSTTASTSTKRWIDEGDSCDPKITSTVKGYPKGMYITDWLKCDEQTRTYVVAKK